MTILSRMYGNANRAAICKRERPLRHRLAPRKMRSPAPSVDNETASSDESRFDLDVNLNVIR